MQVAWAIHPATGASQGTFVVVVGGPGIASLSGAERWMDDLDPRIANTHDVLFFDARGTGESSPADCPRATDAYVEVQEGPSTAAEFSRACRAEAGVGDEALARYTTREVAGDLESIRRRLGIDRWVLYGESYGTSVVQEYVARFPEHTSALIIDGPIDRRLPPAEFWGDAARGFDEVLARTYDACLDDRICRTSMDDPRDAMKRLASRLSRTTPVWEVEDGSGRTRPVRITTSLVEDVTWSSMYDTTGRMLFLRALAADAHGDHWPIEHLAVLGAGESTFSDDSSTFVYYATLCGDTRTALVPDDTGGQYVDAGKRLGLWELATTDIYLTPLPCLTWPSQPASWQPPADPGDVPTLVITATADPVTRETEARPLAQRLPNARLIETLGGSHVMFGRGHPCVDDPVVQLVLHGELPTASRTCDGSVMDDFVAPTATAGRDFKTPLDAVMALDRELMNAPEYAYWDGSSALRIPCRVSGSIEVTAESDGDHLRLDDCAWASLYAFDGRGTIDWATGEVRLELRHDRGSITYRRDADDATSLEGTWDGSAIRLSAEP